ncbi:hypothetical protein D3C78_1158560 [compost metagenome]
MPRTPFIGVRISWLIFARNSALALISALLAARSRLMLKRSSVMRRWRSLNAMLISRPLMQMTSSKVVSRPWGSIRVSPNRAGRMTSVPRLNTTMAATKRRAGR